MVAVIFIIVIKCNQFSKEHSLVSSCLDDLAISTLILYDFSSFWKHFPRHSFQTQNYWIEGSIYGSLYEVANLKKNVYNSLYLIIHHMFILLFSNKMYYIKAYLFIFYFALSDSQQIISFWKKMELCIYCSTSNFLEQCLTCTKLMVNICCIDLN